MDTLINEQLARSESALIELLATCFFRPTLKLARKMQNNEISGFLEGTFINCKDEKIDAALAMLRDFSESIDNKEPDDVRLMLEVDYNRLFVGPSQLLAPPYESFYKTEKGDNGRGHLRGPSEREVLAEYESHGYAMPETFVELPDHLAVELEYLALLASQEADAWALNDTEKAVALQNDGERFRTKHLCSWFNEVAKLIEGGARQPFYPALALITCRTLYL